MLIAYAGDLVGTHMTWLPCGLWLGMDAVERCGASIEQASRLARLDLVSAFWWVVLVGHTLARADSGACGCL